MYVHTSCICAEMSLEGGVTATTETDPIIVINVVKELCAMALSQAFQTGSFSNICNIRSEFHTDHYHDKEQVRVCSLSTRLRKVKSLSDRRTVGSEHAGKFAKGRR